MNSTIMPESATAVNRWPDLLDILTRLHRAVPGARCRVGPTDHTGAIIEVVSRRVTVPEMRAAVKHAVGIEPTSCFARQLTGETVARVFVAAERAA